MDPKCINLKRRLGRRFKVVYEGSYRAEYGPNARGEDPWLMIIPCKYGQLYPWDESTLAASVDGYPKVAGRLRRLKCCRVHQDGDFGELTVLFDIADFAKVARIMRPRRRRQISQAERERLRAMGFQKGQEAHVNVQHTARREASEAPDDPEALPTVKSPALSLETHGGCR